jgi:hypothetical protein
MIQAKLAHLDDRNGYMAYNVDAPKLIRQRQTCQAVEGKYLSLVRLFQLLLALDL